MHRLASMCSAMTLPLGISLICACQPTPQAAPSATKADSATPEPKEKPTKPKKAKDANSVDPKPENVLASVDGKLIDPVRLKRRFNLKMHRMKEESQRNRTQQTRWLRRVTEELVWETAYQAAIDAEGLTIDQKEADTFLQEMKDSAPDWQAYLDKNALDDDAVRQAHITQVAEQMLLKARGMTKPTKEDAKAFYEEHKAEAFMREEEMIRASHILAAEGPREGHERVQPVTREQRLAASEDELKKWHADAMEHSKYLRAEAMKPGVDFNEFARQHSEGPGRARGGDMGLFPKKQMVPVYAEAAWALKIGEVSDVVETSKGIYFIKLFERHPPGILPYSAVEADILTQIENRRFHEAKTALREELTKRHTIEYGMAETGKAPQEEPAKAPKKDGEKPSP